MSARVKTVHSCALCETLDGQNGWMPLDGFSVAKNWLFIISSIPLNKLAIFRGFCSRKSGKYWFSHSQEVKKLPMDSSTLHAVPWASAESLRTEMLANFS